MQIKFLSFIGLVVLFYSCTEQKQQDSQRQKPGSKKEYMFFAVTDYIRGQLSEIDSLPITPLRIVSHKGWQDSVWMKKENIRPFAGPLLHPEIDSAYLNNFYEEKSFLDQTINSITLTYEPKNDSADFKTIIIYIDPTKNKVTRIYLVKEIVGSTGNQTIQLTWKSNKWCKITTIIEQKDNPPDIKEEVMKWDFNE